MLTNVTLGDKGRNILGILLEQGAMGMVVVVITCGHSYVECVFSGHVLFMAIQWLLFDTFIHKVKMDSLVTY